MTGGAAGEVILYQRDDGAPALEVRLEEETVWLSQQQIAELFQTSRTNIVEHLRNIYNEAELDEAATCRRFRQVRTEGSRQVAREIPFYNLDAIISVGYRVKSRVATQFRIWATERLRKYLIKGFTMDDAKLKNLGGGSYWRELLERIRDIRSSEKVLYRQVLDLYATVWTTTRARQRPPVWVLLDDAGVSLRPARARDHRVLQDRPEQASLRRTRADLRGGHRRPSRCHEAEHGAHFVQRRATPQVRCHDREELLGRV